jgi:hypothetical protein
MKIKSAAEGRFSTARNGLVCGHQIDCDRMLLFAVTKMLIITARGHNL